MKRRNAAMIVVGVVVGALAVGSGLTAWATWSVATTNGVATLRGDILPAMSAPDAALAGGVPKISWKAAKPPQAVGGYAVARHVQGGEIEVCRVPATTLTCNDTATTPGSSVAYTVRALAGDRWSGTASPHSDLLIVPGGATGLAARNPVPADTDGAGPRKKEPANISQQTGGDTGGPAGSGTPTTAPAPGPTSAEPTAGADPKETEAASTQTVTSGEESGADTSG